ncbi:MAG: DUF3800 domain-containing protein [Erysipelotrichaceae bacterium]|nr:DUF3800 domain-containing protein [Erysipelotrichaceae bacterium]
MNLYIYSDESGVFDKVHYDYFVFAGIIIAGNEDKDMWSRKYAAAERSINVGGKYGNRELKASKISVKDKNKLFRSLNQCHKFAVVIHQDELMDKLYEIKKEKQRYLDYVYKMIVEEAIYDLSDRGIIDINDIERIIFNVDEHATATNGQYELHETLEREFILGTFNYDYTRYYPPILPKGKVTEVNWCNSANKLLIRAADIIANKVNFCCVNDKLDGLEKTMNFYLVQTPRTATQVVVQYEEEINEHIGEEE